MTPDELKKLKSLTPWDFTFHYMDCNADACRQGCEAAAVAKMVHELVEEVDRLRGAVKFIAMCEGWGEEQMAELGLAERAALKGEK